MRKGLIIFYCVVIGIIFVSGAAANSKGGISYESEISKLITFYENQLFLIDSDFKILSDIGKDAKRRLDYLKAEKESLMMEMRARQVKQTPERIKSFAVQRIPRAGVGLAYTPLK